MEGGAGTSHKQNQEPVARNQLEVSCGRAAPGTPGCPCSAKSHLAETPPALGCPASLTLCSFPGKKRKGGEGARQDSRNHSDTTLQKQMSPSLLRTVAEVGFISAEVRPSGGRSPRAAALRGCAPTRQDLILRLRPGSFSELQLRGNFLASWELFWEKTVNQGVPMVAQWVKKLT